MKLSRDLHRGLSLYFSPYEQDQVDRERADAALRELLKLPDGVQLVLNKPTGPDVIEDNIRAIIDDTISGVLALSLPGLNPIPFEGANLQINLATDKIIARSSGSDPISFAITTDTTGKPKIAGLENWIKTVLSPTYKLSFQVVLTPCAEFPMTQLTIREVNNFPESVCHTLGLLIRKNDLSEEARIRIQKLLRQIVFTKEDGTEHILEVLSFALLPGFGDPITIKGKLDENRLTARIIHPYSNERRQIEVNILLPDGTSKNLAYNWSQQ